MWYEKRGDKYVYYERYKDPVNGKRKRTSVTLNGCSRTDKRAAQEALSLHIRKLQSITEPIQDITLKELTDRYSEAQKASVRPQTYISNQHRITGLLRILGEDTIANRINAVYVETKFRESGQKNSTLNERLIRLKAIFRWAYRKRYVLDISFLDQIDKFADVPHREKIEDKYMEEDELALVMKCMKCKPWHLLTEFLVLSGLRIGEAISLKKEDIDSDFIHVRDTYSLVTEEDGPTKTGTSTRDVPIQTQLKDCIRRINAFVLRRQLCFGHKSDLFFPNEFGEHISYGAYKEYLARITQKKLGRRLTPHALRHTHVSLLAAAGVPLEVITRRVGHKDSKITRDIYFHVTKKMKLADADAVRNVKII